MEELRLKLIETCNKSGLPLEAVLFVVRDVYRDVNETFETYKKRNKEDEENDN